MKRRAARLQNSSDGSGGNTDGHALRRFVRRGYEQDLISFLAAAFEVSRRGAKRLLDERRVFVNGRRVWMARHVVQPGDTIEVHTTQYNVSEQLTTLVEADPYLIVDKPAGRTTNEDSSSVETLLRRLRSDEGWTAVHRLDRDTSGCLLFARTSEAARRMIPLFRDRRIEKTYWALVLGAFPRNLNRISSPIEGRPAISRVRVLAARTEASLLEVRIETGRTHQIRRHMLEAGHPILGDRAYGTSRQLDARARALPRQMLHARRISFAHPDTGCHVTAESPMPEDFRSALLSYGLPNPL